MSQSLFLLNCYPPVTLELNAGFCLDDHVEKMQIASGDYFGAYESFPIMVFSSPNLNKPNIDHSVSISIIF